MKFSDVFRAPKKVLSFEFFPPGADADLDQVKSLISALAKESPDFMTVTYGAGGGTRSRTEELVSYIHTTLGELSVAHLTCVGHSTAEIDAVLDNLSAKGISNLVALRGDPPKGQEVFTPHPEGFANACQLVEHISKRGSFSMAVAGYPEGHKDSRSPQSDMDYLKRKVEAGGEVILTQLFFDEDFYFRFCDRALTAGITVPIVPGVLPIGNVKQIKRFTAMCGASIPARILESLAKLESEPEAVVQFGTEEAIRMCTALLKNGAPGIHIYTLNKSTQTVPLVQALRRSNLLN